MYDEHFFNSRVGLKALEEVLLVVFNVFDCFNEVRYGVVGASKTVNIVR